MARSKKLIGNRSTWPYTLSRSRCTERVASPASRSELEVADERGEPAGDEIPGEQQRHRRPVERARQQVLVDELFAEDRAQRLQQSGDGEPVVAHAICRLSGRAARHSSANACRRSSAPRGANRGGRASVVGEWRRPDGLAGAALRFSMCIEAGLELLIAPLRRIPAIARQQRRVRRRAPRHAPSLSTMIRSASATADRRWLTMIAVRPVTRAPQMCEDARLGARVHGAQCVVQQQQRRIGKQRAGDRHPLPLPAGQRDAALAHQRVVAVAGSAGCRHAGPPCAPTRSISARVAVGPRQRDVVGDRRREQERLLRHPRDGGAQACQRVVGEREPAPANRSCRQRVVAQQQVQQRRLAGAGRPDDAERFAGPQLERRVGERAAPLPWRPQQCRWIRERDALEPDRAGRWLRYACRDRRSTAVRAATARGAPTPPCRARSATTPSPPRTSARSAGRDTS